jgi:hypothetical protein
MNILIRGLLFHAISLVIFSIIYFILYEHFDAFENVIDFDPEVSTNTKLITSIYFATTVESGVGLTSLQPTTTLSKLLVSLQQICMIVSNVFILYVSYHMKPKKH